MQHVLVTGATGLLGSHIAELLLERGCNVRALVRNVEGANWLGQLGVDLHAGDILDAESFTRAARGCDVIFHAAAAVTPRGGWEEFRSINVGGARNAVSAAEGSGARLVQVSSVAVYGAAARYGAAPTDEDTPLAELPEGALYPRSKRESELLVLEAHAAGRIWATAVRPDVIYGERDRQFVPRIARLLRFGVAPLPGGGRSVLPIVHAANVANGALLAATSDAAGGRPYNLANDFDVTAREFVGLAGKGLGTRVRIVAVPEAAARAGVRTARTFLSVAARSPAVAQMAGATVDFLTRGNPFSSERAKRELDWSPSMRPGTGVPAAFRWWKRNGGQP
ncbi:MAG: NAD-dependent epimerase/dehydratase family protein [Gemmatimonadaceae bacterium]